MNDLEMIEHWNIREAIAKCLAWMSVLFGAAVAFAIISFFAKSGVALGISLWCNVAGALHVWRLHRLRRRLAKLEE